jgi:hypothetical protein
MVCLAGVSTGTVGTKTEAMLREIQSLGADSTVTRTRDGKADWAEALLIRTAEDKSSMPTRLQQAVRTESLLFTMLEKELNTPSCDSVTQYKV